MDSGYNLFICWSGERSKAIGLALRDWLPKVIQDLKPWISEKDIEKGTLWDAQLTEQLKDLKIGILCLTPENLDSIWIHFEAGALAKTVNDSYICPYLYKAKRTELRKPLSRFQATETDQEDTRELIRTINKALGEKLSVSQLDETFEIWWPKLKDRLEKIPDLLEEKDIHRSPEDMIAEVLESVRDISRRLKTPVEQNDIDKFRNLAESQELFMHYITKNPDRVFTPEDLRRIWEDMKRLWGIVE